MSGGSYDYLCDKDAEQLLGGKGASALEQMTDRLSGIPGAEDAARETAELALTLRQMRTRVGAMIGRLRGVWRAVEWCDSGDTGPDHIAANLMRYRGEEPPKDLCYESWSELNPAYGRHPKCRCGVTFTTFDRGRYPLHRKGRLDLQPDEVAP